MLQSGYPDVALCEELISGWKNHSNEMPLVEIFSAPNASLVQHMTVAVSGVREDVAGNLAAECADLPFWPIVLSPLGSVEKPRSDKRRLTHNLSNPHALVSVREDDLPGFYRGPALLTDPSSSSLRLVSPNANTNADELAAVRLPGASHLAEATWVLHSAGIQIVAFKMDETAAYKQTILNSAEAWKNCAVVEDKILLPFVLGFGSCEGPSDYQRLSEVKHAILCHEAALLLGSSTSSNEQGGMWLYSPPSASMCNAVFKDRRVCSWIMFRASLFPNSPEQWLPFYLGIYLDDHNVLALGWEVAEWLISVMFETADKFGWILSSSNGRRRVSLTPPKSSAGHML